MLPDPSLADMRRERNRRKDAERRKRNALARLRGEETGYVDAAPIRARVKALTDLGWSFEAIIAASECEGTAAGLRLVANGTHRRASRIWLPILSMPVTLAVPDSVPDTCFVPTLGATRRIRALMAIGWRHDDISEFIGRASHHLSSGRYPRMTALDWRIVDAAYEKLSASRGGSAKSLTRARKAGFVPPMGWNDIDNPTELPKHNVRSTNDPAEWQQGVDMAVVWRLVDEGKRVRNLTAAEGAEACRILLGRGLSGTQIQQRYGLNVERTQRGAA